MLGFPETSWQKKFAQMYMYPPASSDWLKRESMKYQRNHIIRHHEISVMDKLSAAAVDVAFFDTGEGFRKTLDAAFEFLVIKSPE